MADITNLFRATVKAVKLKNKVLNDIPNTSAGDDKSILTKRPANQSEFESNAKNLLKTVTKLKEFLLENRKEYVSSGSLLTSGGSSMSETERDQIDVHAQKIIRSCQETIVRFRVETDQHKSLPQVREHRHAVMILLEAYLKDICKIYSEQKAVRVKRIVDRKRISRLEPERRHSHLTRNQLKKDLNLNHRPLKAVGEQQASVGESAVKASESNQPSSSHQHLDENPVVNDEEISPEEAQMFEQENQTLYEEMNSMVEEVRQIEGQVVEIAKLQEIFTEKILEQDLQIHNISSTVVGTTESIIDANEEIREAIKKKAEFRVYILFFLVVCSLSLLFLDWYNH